MFQQVSFGVVALSLALSLSGKAAEPGDKGVSITELPGKVRVEIDGGLFTEYYFQGAPHLYYYPVIGPGGLAMTRDYPMKTDTAGEERDHPHHRSLWYSHGSVDGVDFWSETPKAGKIVHGKFLELRSGTESGVIRSQNNWVAPDGEIVCTDERTFRVYARPASERLFDFEITLRSGAKEVVLGDTKEGSFGMRIAESMRLTHGKLPGQGHIVLSTGIRDGDTWGKRAEWCDYFGPVEGKTAGIAIFDHPQNPQHPTRWHVRDYGLFAANPFGLHDFEKKPPGSGNLSIPAGQSVTFRYRVYLHPGDDRQADVARRYRDYAGAIRP